MIENIFLFMLEHFWMFIYFILGMMALCLSMSLIEKVWSLINKLKKKHE